MAEHQGRARPRHGIDARKGGHGDFHGFLSAQIPGERRDDPGDRLSLEQSLTDGAARVMPPSRTLLHESARYAGRTPPIEKAHALSRLAVPAPTRLVAATRHGFRRPRHGRARTARAA